MNEEQSQLVKSIKELEAKRKKLSRKASDRYDEAGKISADVYNISNDLRNLYLKLKEVTEKAKVTEEDKNS